MDHQPDPGAFRIPDERDGVRKSGSQGLLTEHMNASLPRETADVAVRVRRRDDIDEIRALSVEHLGDVGIDAVDVESSSGFLRPLLRRVAQRHERRAPAARCHAS